jgi:6-phosphogluconolactonase
MPVVVRSDVQALAETFVSDFEAAARDAIAARGVFTCALTGGGAAKDLYPRLAEAQVDWSRVHLYFGDERAVPPTDPESNFHLARVAFVVPAEVPDANVHRMEGERPLDEAARAYEAALPPTLDLVHLGIGPDGHVCSLFPGHPLLEERERRVSFLEDSPKPPPRRITFTFRPLAEARLVWFLVLGSAKAGAVRASLTDPTSPLPAARAHRAAKAPRWYLDAAAAALLPSPKP